MMDIVIPLNETRTKYMPFRARYPFDPFDYYYFVFMHTLACGIVFQTVAISVDSMYVKSVYHVCGKFAIVG